MSLRTRSFRAAEHLAALLDVEFGNAFAGAEQTVTTNGDNGATSPDLNTTLRGHLNAVLDADKAIRVERPTGPQGEAAPSRIAELLARLTAGQTAAEIAAEVQAAEAVVEARARWDGPGTQAAIRRAAALKRAFRGDTEPWPGLLADATPERVAAADRAVKFLAGEMFSSAPAAPSAADPAASAPIVLPVTPPVPEVPPAEERVAPTVPQPAAPAVAAPEPAKPTFSALEEGFFDFGESVKDATHQFMGQERGTLRRFREVRGDRPVDSYTTTA